MKFCELTSGDSNERIASWVIGDRDGAGSFRDWDTSFAAFTCVRLVPSSGHWADRSASCDMANRKSDDFFDRCSQEEGRETGLTVHAWIG